MRNTISPSFTSSKMRLIFNLMQDCAEQFTDNLANNNAKVIEMKDVASRFANDVIATTAFGIECDSLTEKDNTFYLMGKDLISITSGLRGLKFMLIFTLPSVCKV